MKRKKMWCLLSGAAAFTLLCSGCGGGQTEVREDPNKVPDTPYEISWYVQGTAQKGVQEIEAAANEYLKDKLNATLKLNILESGQYKKKMSTMIAAAEDFDMAFCANWMLDYRINAANGAFAELDSYLDSYMPKTKEAIGAEILDNTRVNGKIYAIPALKEFAQQKGWVYRKDIADKYGIDMSQYKNFEELKPVLERIKANEPDMQYPIDWSKDKAPASRLNFSGLASTAGVFNDGTYPDNKVVNLIDTPEFLEACRLAHQYYKDGLIKEDIMTTSDTTQRFKDGKVFCYFEYLKPGKAAETYKTINYPIDQAGIDRVVQDQMAGTGSMTAISATSRNPARVLRFMELYNTDPYLNNLIVYGIEDKNYRKLDENTVELIPNSSYSLSGSQWMLGNVFINHLTKDEDPNKIELLKDFNEEAVRPVFNGFTCDTEKIQQQVAACVAVDTQYRAQCVLGEMDPDTVIEEYRSKLKTAGIDEIVAEVQRQYDEFLSKKK